MAEDKKENKKEKENKRKESGKSESVCERVKKEAPASTCMVENPNEAKQTSSIQKQTETLGDPGISSSPILNGSCSTTVTTVIGNIVPQPTMTVAGNHSKSPQTSTTPAATHSQSQLTNVAQTVQEKASKLRKFLNNLIKLASDQKSSDIGKTVIALVESLMVGKLTEEQFAANLQKTLDSPPQPNLVDFLKKTVPLLRAQSRSLSTVPQLIGPQQIISQQQQESVCEGVKKEVPTSTCTVENPNEAKQTNSIQNQTETLVDPGISSSPILNGARSTTDTTVVRNISPQPMVTVAGNHSKSSQPSTTTAAMHSQSHLTNVALTVQESVSKLRELLSNLIRVGSDPRSTVVGKTVKDLVESLMDGRLTAEQFAGNMQKTLNSPPRPHFVELLKKTVPLLRAQSRSLSTVPQLIGPELTTGRTPGSQVVSSTQNVVLHSPPRSTAAEKVVACTKSQLATPSTSGAAEKLKAKGVSGARSNGNDTNNVTSAEDVHPMSHQEKEELHVVRKRVVNTTMLSAIGPTKKRKLENALEGSSTPKADERVGSVNTTKETSGKQNVIQKQIRQEEFNAGSLGSVDETLGKLYRIPGVQKMTHFQAQLREKELEEATLFEELRGKEQQEENSRRQLREIEQQLREKESQEANLQEQLREKEQQVENSEDQLSQKNQEMTQLRKRLEREKLQKANLHEQLGEKEQQNENLQRQLSEKAQQLTNAQEQLQEKVEETANLQNQITALEGQLRARDQDVNELEISLSIAQGALNESQQQQAIPITCEEV